MHKVTYVFYRSVHTDMFSFYYTSLEFCKQVSNKSNNEHCES